MAKSLGTGPLPARPKGSRPISLKEDDHASLLSGLPVPREAWERLEAFGKARAPTSSGGACHLADPGAAAREADLGWYSNAAAFGVELCSLQMYVVEWLHRAERGLIPAPSQRTSGFMLSLAAKLSRASLKQHLRMLVKATSQRRELIVPLCKLPPLATQTFSRLPPVGPDLFAGRFQELVSGEAERRKALKETMFPLDLRGAAAPSSFRGQPSAGGSLGRGKKRSRKQSRSQPQPQRPGARERATASTAARPRARTSLFARLKRGTKGVPRGSKKGRKL